MRLFIIIFFSLIVSLPVYSTENVNSIGCTYLFRDGSWKPWLVRSGITWDLDEGMEMQLSDAWTSYASSGTNYGFCTKMIGTSSNSNVIIYGVVYSAKEFSPTGPNNDCSFDGLDVKIVSEIEIEVKRGEFISLLSDWLPPNIPSIYHVEYFPTLDEISKIEEIRRDKCLELSP